MSKSTRSSAYRGFLFLFALFTALISVTFLSTPAIAGPAISSPLDYPTFYPGDTGTVIDLREGYGLTSAIPSITDAATTETIAMGSAEAVGTIAPPLVLATGIIYGLKQEWNYFHPKTSDGLAQPPSSDTDYSAGCFTGSHSPGCVDQAQYTTGSQQITDTVEDMGVFTYPNLTTHHVRIAVVTAGVSSPTQFLAIQSNGSGCQASNVTSGSGTLVGTGQINAPPGVTSVTYDFTMTCNGNFTPLSIVTFGNGYGGPLSLTYTPATSGATSYPTTGPTSATFTPQTSCSDSSTATSDPVTYDPTVAGSTGFTMPSCPAGSIPTGLKVNDDSVPDGSPAIQWTAPSTWTNPSASPYPNCLPGGINAPCTMRLGIVTATGIQTCGDQADCTTYTVQDPSSTATQVTEADGNTYECEYGPYAISVVSCDSLGEDEGTDTAPDTGEEPTGTPVLGLPAVPDASCFPHGWGMLNPVSWVEDPVKCALKWAFVPSTSVSAQLTALRTNALSKPPLDIINSGLGFFGACIGIVPSTPVDSGTTSNPDTGFPIPADVPDARDYLSEQPVSSERWQLFQGVGDWMQGDGHVIYLIGEIAIIAGFCGYAWQRVTASFGSKEGET